MPLKIESSVELQEILTRLDMFGKQIFPETARAINISSVFMQKTWVNIAQGQDTSGKPENVKFYGSIDYANSIRIIHYSPFHKVVYSDSKIGKKLQEGSKEIDMKPALVSGPKSRVAEDGHRYNIIPFRHMVKKLKKSKIGGINAYAVAKQLQQQKVIGFRIDSEGTRRMVYEKWNKEKKLDVKDRFLAGLVRMKTSTGGTKSSAYLTFRVVNLSQVGKWIRKAQSSWDIISQVKDKTESKIKEFVIKAIKRDMNIGV